MWKTFSEYNELHAQHELQYASTKNRKGENKIYCYHPEYPYSGNLNSMYSSIPNKIMGVSKWRKIRERDDSVGRVNSRAKALFNLGCGESP